MATGTLYRGLRSLPRCWILGLIKNFGKFLVWYLTAQQLNTVQIVYTLLSEDEDLRYHLSVYTPITYEWGQTSWISLISIYAPPNADKCFGDQYTRSRVRIHILGDQYIHSCVKIHILDIGIGIPCRKSWAVSPDVPPLAWSLTSLQLHTRWTIYNQLKLQFMGGSKI